MQSILVVLTAVVLIGGASLPAQAGVKSLTVKVDGLACPFCAYGLEKKLKKVEGVETLKIDVNTGEVALNVTAGTRLTAPLGAEEKASIGLVAQVQKAVEEGGFTPRALGATLEGQVVAQNGETHLRLSGTGESLMLEASGSVDDLDKLKGDPPLQVAGTLHPETSPLRFTVERINSSESTAVMCRLQISGMACTGCVEAIQASLEKQEGVRGIQIDLESGVAEIVLEDSLSGETLAEVVNALGMEGMPVGTFKARVLKE